MSTYFPRIFGSLNGEYISWAFDSFKDTVESIAEAGLRHQVKIMIGGGTVTDEVCQYSGADACGEDAVAAVTLSNIWVENI